MKIVYNDVFFKTEPGLLIGLFVTLIGIIIYSLVASYISVKKHKNDK